MSKILVNLPHSSKFIPNDLRTDILLNETELEQELNIITDLYTDRIFNDKELGLCKKDMCIAKVSRFICDTERFEDDASEEMAKLGMGAVYTKTASGKNLRVYSREKRQDIIYKFYTPYHKELESLTEIKLTEYGECLILDCHSFNEKAKYLKLKSYKDICLGTDPYHTPDNVISQLKELFEAQGYSVSINEPFEGSIVPLKYYTTDKRVKSIMIEINRRLYVTGESEIIEDELAKLTSACKKAVKLLE